MKFTKTALTVSALAAGTFLAIAAPLSASAHISADPTDTAAGSYTVITFALPHGCDGSATTAIRIDVPEGIASVTPTAKPSWTVTEVAADLDTPTEDAEGNPVTTRTQTVVYSAASPLPDGLRDTFALSLPLPADAAGKTLEFPVLQTCETGETNWNESTVAGENEPAHPAPAITVTEATADEHGHEATTSGGSSGDVLARVLGIGGLAVGAVGVVLAVTARRKTSA